MQFLTPILGLAIGVGTVTLSTAKAAQAGTARKEILVVKKLLHATGIDYFDFINKPDIDGKFKLLVSAQKGGR